MEAGPGTSYRQGFEPLTPRNNFDRQEDHMAGELSGIGPYAVPTRSRMNDAALAALQRGGEVLSHPHRAARADYDSDPPGLKALRKSAPAATWTCGCGQVGTVVEMAPGAFPPVAGTEGSVRSKGALRICIRCDAGHLMPNLVLEGADDE